MSNPQSIVKEFLSIKPEQMKLVVDEANAKRLEKIHKVKITLPAEGGWIIKIEGPAEMVSTAKKGIEDSLPYESNFPVENKYIDAILNYETQQAIIEEHNVEIGIVRCESVRDLIVVKGKKSECEAAKKNIKSLMKNSEAYKETIILTQDQMDHISKDSFSILKTIESLHCVSVSIGDPSPSEDGRYEIEVKGPADWRVSAAKQGILDIFHCTINLKLGDKFVEKIRDKSGGQTLRSLEEEHKVKISFANGKAFISGMKERAEAARRAIESTIRSVEQTPRGGGGQTLPSLEEGNKVKISFANGKALISWMKERAEAAWRAIKSIFPDTHENKTVV